MKRFKIVLRHGTAALTAALALAMTASGAFATTIQFNLITATWQNATPSAVATYTGNGTAHAKARWGTPANGNGQSGYNFDAPASQPVTAIVPPSPSADFVLGTFSHVNEPITGSSITGIQLAVTMDVNIGGTDVGNQTFLFDFTHDETDNNLNPCPYGGANGQGINVNGCADRVTVTVDTHTASFLVGGNNYTVNIEGFEVGGVTVSVPDCGGRGQHRQFDRRCDSDQPSVRARAGIACSARCSGREFRPGSSPPASVTIRGGTSGERRRLRAPFSTFPTTSGSSSPGHFSV